MRRRPWRSVGRSTCHRPMRSSVDQSSPGSSRNKCQHESNPTVRATNLPPYHARLVLRSAATGRQDGARSEATGEYGPQRSPDVDRTFSTDDRAVRGRDARVDDDVTRSASLDGGHATPVKRAVRQNEMTAPGPRRPTTPPPR